MANKNYEGSTLDTIVGGQKVIVVPGAATITLEYPVQWLDNVSFEFTSTGTLTLASTFWLSNSHKRSFGSAPGSWTVFQAGSWTDVSASTSYPVVKKFGTDPAGAPITTPVLWCAWQVPTTWVRVQFVVASGAGTITGYFSAKGV